MRTPPRDRGRRRLLSVFAGVAIHVVASAPVTAQQAAPRLDAAQVSATVDGLIREHGQGIEASLWLGGVGAGVFERHVSVPRPTASAIKSFYLVELFDRFAGALDRPLPGVEGVLADDAHPAISHFTPEQRAEIRRELIGATVRRVGLVMMGTAPASNIVYNAAANVTTAVLGGPEALTALIRKRDAAFAAVSARRYMLRNRREHGDNEAPAIALAALYQRLAARRLASIDAPTMDALHEALRRRDDPALGRHYEKSGNLDSDPLGEVRAGWYDTAKGPLVYVVMTTQPTPGPAGRAASSQQLAKTADAVTRTIVVAGSR